MNKLLLTFLLSPTIFSSALSFLLTIDVAHAAEPVNQIITSECQRTSYTRPLTCQRVSQTSRDSRFTSVSTFQSAQQADENRMLEFSEEESDAAIQMFGCDCLVCINAIRQSRGLSPVT